MSGGGKRSTAETEASAFKAKAAGNSDSLDLRPPRPPPTLPWSGSI